MVVRFENLWISVPLMLVPISFGIVMMGLIRIWMFSAPRKIRRRPEYSMHVMQEEKRAELRTRYYYPSTPDGFGYRHDPSFDSDARKQSRSPDEETSQVAPPICEDPLPDTQRGGMQSWNAYK